MREELDMREKEYEALIIRARASLNGIGQPEQTLDSYALTLDDNTAKEAAILSLTSLSAQAETLEEAVWELAASLHDSGTPFRLISEAMEVPITTVKRRIEKIKAGRE